MKVNLMMVKEANPLWFSKENKRFFDDKGYEVVKTRRKEEYWLVQKTYGASRWYDEKGKLFYKLHGIGTDYKLTYITDYEFESIKEIKDYINKKGDYEDNSEIQTEG